MDSAALKALAVLAVLRGAAALYGLYGLAAELIGILTEQRLLGDVFSYGFVLAMQIVRIYIAVMYTLLGAGAFLLLFGRRSGARLCRICYMHLRIVWVLFAFGINYLRINNIFTAEYLVRTVFIDVCFALIVLCCGNLKRAMDDISYELLGYEAEYAGTRALTGQAMALGIAALIELAVDGYLYIFINLFGTHFDALYKDRLFDMVYFVSALMIFGVSFANTALRKHIRAKYLCSQEKRPYVPAFQPMTAVSGAFAAGLYALIHLKALSDVIYDRLYFGSGLSGLDWEIAMLLIPYALRVLAYGMFALALAGIRRNLLTAFGAAAEMAGLTGHLFGGACLPFIGIDSISAVAALVWWALVLLVSVSAATLGRLSQEKVFPVWLRAVLCALAALLFVPVLVNGYVPMMQKKDTAYYIIAAVSALAVRVTLMLHVGKEKANPLPVIQS